MLALSPDGRVGVVETDRLDLLVFEINTLQERFRIPNRSRGPVSSLLFTGNGRHLIVANGDSTVTIHDLFAGAAPLGETTGADADETWAELAGPAATAFHAMQQLAQAPDAAVEGLRSRIRPTRPLPEQVDRFVRELDAPRYQKREIAQGELTRWPTRAARHCSLLVVVNCRRRCVSASRPCSRRHAAPTCRLMAFTSRAVELLERLQTPKAVAPARMVGRPAWRHAR